MNKRKHLASKLAKAISDEWDGKEPNIPNFRQTTSKDEEIARTNFIAAKLTEENSI